MSKGEKRTILKQIFKGMKRKAPLKTSDEVVKDATVKTETKEILKVINKEKENGRITDTTLGDGKAIVNNPDGSEQTLREANFQVKKADYEIEDLTKKEDIATEDIKPPLETEVNINEILKSLDNSLDEKEYHHTLNILTTRSSKSAIKESALVEYTVYNKSYVMSLIVESEDEGKSYKVMLNNSYGKPIYAKEGLENSNVNQAVLFPFNAIALREKVLKENNI